MWNVPRCPITLAQPDILIFLNFAKGISQVVQMYLAKMFFAVVVKFILSSFFFLSFIFLFRFSCNYSFHVYSFLPKVHTVLLSSNVAIWWSVSSFVLVWLIFFHFYFSKSSNKNVRTTNLFMLSILKTETRKIKLV